MGQSRRLETMLHEDPLTGLFNRRYVLTRLAGLISGARRHGRPLSVAMIDIDHFKRLNDEHGHDAGDAALVEIDDRAARPAARGGRARPPRRRGVPRAAARRRRRARRGGGREPARERRGGASARTASRRSGATVSIGWATWDGEESADALVKRADMALYAAKEAGRNAVRGAENLSASLPRRT